MSDGGKYNTIKKHCNRIWPFSFEDYWLILFYCTLTCVFSELMPTDTVDDSRPYPAKQTTLSAPCRLMTVIKVDWSVSQEARMYLCDYLLDQ